MTTTGRSTCSRRRRRRPAGGFRDEPIRTTVRGIGQLFITFGVVLLLFVVYEVYVTDFFGAQKQAAGQGVDGAALGAAVAPRTCRPDPSAARRSRRRRCVGAAAPVRSSIPAARTRNYDTEIGQGFANIDIPAFGADYVFTVVEGTTTEDLYGNPGHYDDTQYPGELGNFAVAGHRVSARERRSTRSGTLNSCDALVIETQDEWFVYRVLPMAEEAAGWNPAARAECADVAPLTGAYEGVGGSRDRRCRRTMPRCCRSPTWTPPARRRSPPPPSGSSP